MSEFKTVIYISGSKIKAGTVALSKEPQLGDTVEYDWTPETLAEVLAGIKKIYGNEKVKVLLDDELNSSAEFLTKLNLAIGQASLSLEGIVAYSAVKDSAKDPLTALALKEDSTAIPAPIPVAVPTEPVKKESSKKYIFLGLGIGLVIALIVGGILISRTAMTKSTNNKPPVISPTPTVEPTPTISLKRTDLKIKILNGSGVSGLAGKAKTYLEGLGYQVTSTGNADSFNYAKTQVKIKEGKKDFSLLLLEDLAKEYQLASESLTLSAADSADAVVILGKN